MLYTPKSKAVVEKSMTSHVNSNQNYCGLTRKLRFMSVHCHSHMVFRGEVTYLYCACTTSIPKQTISVSKSFEYCYSSICTYSNVCRDIALIHILIATSVQMKDGTGINTWWRLMPSLWSSLILVLLRWHSFSWRHPYNLLGLAGILAQLRHHAHAHLSSATYKDPSISFFIPRKNSRLSFFPFPRMVLQTTDPADIVSANPQLVNLFTCQDCLQL